MGCPGGPVVCVEVNGGARCAGSASVFALSLCSSRKCGNFGRQHVEIPAVARASDCVTRPASRK